MKNKKIATVCISCCAVALVAGLFLFNISHAEKSPAPTGKPAEGTLSSVASEPKEHVEDHAGEHVDEHLEEHADEHEEDHMEDHAAAPAEDPDSHEDEIEVTPEAMKLAEITLAKAGMGRISITVKLSGEVGFNEERLVRITPRFPGIIKEARFRKGEFVKAGDVVAVIDSNESMASYSLKAPLSGRIIEKQAVPGEYVSEEESIYVLADLSTVWVNLAVYPKDADKVKSGQKLSIAAVGSDTVTLGSVYYVTPVIDVQTRTLTACVVLPNEDNAWRPGSFVHAHMEAGEGVEGLVVDKNAVQILDNKSVVFIQHEPSSFKPVEVVTGEADSRNILIVSGLNAGDEYVNNGAFELKAKIVTSSLGDHAGHGH
jgi:cobalt-zinc-cadmium efflux system membrane fusion protein